MRDAPASPPRPGRRAELRIVFVHTPMATIRVPERQAFWRNFDLRYHAAHPGLRHMRRNLWELPHWMTWLGGVLEHEGFTNLAALDFYSCECAYEGVDAARICQQLRAQPADVYLLSPMTPNLSFALEIADIIKLVHPHSRTIFGGVVATPLREQVAAHPSVDFVVHGRGEHALPHLLRALAGECGLDEVGNLCARRSDGSVVTSSRVYPWMPPAEIPFPKVDLFDREVGQDLRYLRIVYGLGCPYRCAFCTIQTIGRRAEYFPVERVLAEIAAYRARYGSHHNIYFGDETFTVHRKRTLDLCDALAADGTIGFDCQTRLNVVQDETVLDALVRAGCRWIEIGIETINQESQDLFKQRLEMGRLRDALARLRDHGLPVCAFAVNGFPNQSVDDMRRSIDAVAGLLDDRLLQASYLFGLVPYPGSDLYDDPQRFGIEILHRDFKRYHEDMVPVYRTRHAEPEQIYEVFLYGVAELARAMGGRPHFGELVSGAAAQDYGRFWHDPHV